MVVPEPKAKPLAPYSMVNEFALIAPVHEISAELAEILDAINPLGAIQDGGAHVELEVCVKNNPIVGLVPKLPKEFPAGSVI